jgi:hypothetical protein
MEATLWPGRGVRGVLSDETALELYGLSDVNPAKIDVTVPRAHRIRRKIPSAYRIHHEDLPGRDVTLFEGIPIVTPARAIGHFGGLSDVLCEVRVTDAALRGRKGTGCLTRDPNPERNRLGR